MCTKDVRPGSRNYPARRRPERIEPAGSGKAAPANRNSPRVPCESRRAGPISASRSRKHHAKFHNKGSARIALGRASVRQRFRWGDIPNKSAVVTFTIDTAVLAGSSYDPSANHDPHPDSDGSTTTVPKPNKSSGGGGVLRRNGAPRRPAYSRRDTLRRPALRELGDVYQPTPSIKSTIRSCALELQGQSLHRPAKRKTP